MTGPETCCFALTLDRLINPTERASVHAPIALARTLPNIAFTSPDFLKLEARAIFHRRWVAVAFSDQVASPRSALPVTLLGAPLLLTRDQAGILRAFHNLCPYDHCPVALSPAKDIDTLVVRYHGWVYGLDGALRAAPFWNGSARPDVRDVLKSNGGNLVPVRVAEWANVVFVSLDAAGESFQSFIAPAARMLCEVELSKLTPMQDADGVPLSIGERVSSNWKTYTENATINILHESFVHADYAASPQIPRVTPDSVKTYREIIDGRLLAFDFNAADFTQTYGDQSQLPHIGRGAAPPKRGAFAYLYPNFFMSVQQCMLEVGWALPLDPGTTIEDRRFLADTDLATVSDHRNTRLELWKMFAEAGEEDKRIIEAVQRARHSPAIQQNFYSPFWDALHHRFSQLVLEDLERRA